MPSALPSVRDEERPSLCACRGASAVHPDDEPLHRGQSGPQTRPGSTAAGAVPSPPAPPGDAAAARTVLRLWPSLPRPFRFAWVSGRRPSRSPFQVRSTTSLLEGCRTVPLFSRWPQPFPGQSLPLPRPRPRVAAWRPSLTHLSPGPPWASLRVPSFHDAGALSPSRPGAAPRGGARAAFPDPPRAPCAPRAPSPASPMVPRLRGQPNPRVLEPRPSPGTAHSSRDRQRPPSPRGPTWAHLGPTPHLPTCFSRFSDDPTPTLTERRCNRDSATRAPLKFTFTATAQARAAPSHGCFRKWPTRCESPWLLAPRTRLPCPPTPPHASWEPSPSSHPDGPGEAPPPRMQALKGPAPGSPTPARALLRVPTCVRTRAHTHGEAGPLASKGHDPSLCPGAPEPGVEKLLSKRWCDRWPQTGPAATCMAPAGTATSKIRHKSRFLISLMIMTFLARSDIC